MSQIKSSNTRIEGIDTLRGWIMILMALDHVNYFIGKSTYISGEFWGGNPIIPDDFLIFFTRFVTHICAPGFVFLMGIGMSLYFGKVSKTQSHSQIIGHFASRGFILLFMQFILENQLWMIGWDFYVFPAYFGVLAMLGIVMFLSAFFLRFQIKYLLLVAISFFLISQLLIPPPNSFDSANYVFVRIMAIPGKTAYFDVYYSVLPWLAISILGIMFGNIIADSKRNASKIALYAGLSMLLLFPIIRIFGDTLFNLQSINATTLINFLWTVKYPPSTAFILLHLGLFMVLLSLVLRFPEVTSKFKLQFMNTIGQVPLYFYILHLLLFALIGLLVPSNLGLLGVYFVWFIGITMLIPLCNIYRKFKFSTPKNSYWRFF
jgi:uncharacterized membrane protein